MNDLHPPPSIESNIDSFIRLRTLRDEAIASGDVVTQQYATQMLNKFVQDTTTNND
jgi:hypothetical protein